jgi:hypothetical protein
LILFVVTAAPGIEKYGVSELIFPEHYFRLKA